MTEFEELTEIVARSRYRIMPDGYITSTGAGDIATAIQEAGYCKVENQIMVTEGMVRAALMAFYPSIFELRELESSNPSAKSNMTHALYAAFRAWKEAKIR